MSSFRESKSNLLATLRVLMMEHQYCEWTHPYLALLRRPLGVLAMLGISSCLCGLFVAPQGFVVLAAVLSVITIGCVWPWVGIRGVSCQLRFANTRTEEGKPVDAELVITNKWPWPVWGLAVEGGFDAEDDSTQPPAVAVARIGGWSRGYFRWTFTPTTRGCYPKTEPKLVTEFPFGLWKAKKNIEVLSTLIVWPARFPLPPLVLPSGAQSWIGQNSECSTGNSGHRTSVREYRVGDSMRQVHWAKTALYDKLVSYEREGQAITEARIALDTHPSLHAGTGSQSSLEWTVRIAASICETLIRQGVNVSIESQGDQFDSRMKGSNSSLVLDWFALLRTSNRSGKERFSQAQTRKKSTSLFLHITTNRSSHVTEDSIVMVVDQQLHPDPLRRKPQSWIELSQEMDIATQVRRGWQQGLRSRRYAV